MKQMINFDLSAMTHPKSKDDVLALLREVKAELQIVNTRLDEAFARCKRLPVATTA